jgi:hypothetical protein
LLTDDGQIVVVGGFPIPSRALGVTRLPNQPVLYRLSTDVVLQEGPPIQVNATMDDTLVDLTQLAMRAFATEIRRGDAVWLAGGVDGTQGTSFVPRRDSLIISRLDGSVVEGPALPISASGGRAATLRWGTEVLVGGIVESAEQAGIIGPSNQAVLYATGEGSTSCLPAE